MSECMPLLFSRLKAHICLSLTNLLLLEFRMKNQERENKKKSCQILLTYVVSI